MSCTSPQSDALASGATFPSTHKELSILVRTDTRRPAPHRDAGINPRVSALVVSGWFAVSKTIIPEAQEHLLALSARRDTHPLGGLGLSCSSCLNYLHRLGFVLKRPKKRLLKADAAQRETFVAEYAALVDEAQQVGAQVFFVDEAHFRADADLRGKWVLKGAPALVDSTSPRWGEKASYYSAVCLETGEVEWMELEGNSNSATSAAFLRQLREQHAGPLTVIWDNSPAHLGDVLRAYLATPGLRLRLVNLPGYSPDFNADEAIWDWVRQEVTANPVSSTGQALCLGAKSAVQEKVNNFFTQLAGRQPEVKQRCRTVLQTRAEGLLGKAHADPRRPTNVDPTLVSV